MSEENITVRRNDDAGRYEIYVDDALAGFTEVKLRDDKAIFPHTEVDPAFGGRGLGATLVGEALADTARRGETAVPLCPFVVAYLKKNEVEGLKVESAS